MARDFSLPQPSIPQAVFLIDDKSSTFLPHQGELALPSNSSFAAFGFWQNL